MMLLEVARPGALEVAGCCGARVCVVLVGVDAWSAGRGHLIVRGCADSGLSRAGAALAQARGLPPPRRSARGPHAAARGQAREGTRTPCRTAPLGEVPYMLGSGRPSVWAGGSAVHGAWYAGDAVQGAVPSILGRAQDAVQHWGRGHWSKLRLAETQGKCGTGWEGLATLAAGKHEFIKGRET